MEYAISREMAIFTFNSADFISIHNEYLRKGRNHFGILLSKQVPLKESIRRLTSFLYKYTETELQNNIFWV